MPPLKKIVYLFGSGATHATINALDETKKLLTSDIRDKIRKDQKSGIPAEIWNELMDSAVDIEHLISILETNYNYSVAQKIKEYYHKAIIELSREFIQNINKEKYKPNLYSILFDLHKIKGLNEKIISAITLNYEDLLEQSIKSHLGISIDYVIDKNSRNINNNTVKVLKLHGSFNWKNTRLVTFGDMYKIKSDEALWIPPGVDKKKENYPFNVLWGKAFEYFMECDVVRVVGCSLSRNDWGLIPMFYTVMRLTDSNPSMQLEIIDFYDKGNKIKEAYPYLKIKSIIEIPEFEEYMRDLYSIPSGKAIPDYVKELLSSENTKLNIFEMWLKSKGNELMHNSVNISSARKYFTDFVKP